MINLTNLNYEQEVIKSKLPVLVDFWASWCMPCRMIAPIIEEIASQYGGKLKVGKVNVDENPELAQQLMITAVPTLIFYQNGKIIDKVVGALGKDELVKKIEKILKGEKNET